VHTSHLELDKESGEIFEPMRLTLALLAAGLAVWFFYCAATHEPPSFKALPTFDVLPLSAAPVFGQMKNIDNRESVPARVGHGMQIEMEVGKGNQLEVVKMAVRGTSSPVGHLLTALNISATRYRVTFIADRIVAISKDGEPVLDYARMKGNYADEKPQLWLYGGMFVAISTLFFFWASLARLFF